MQAKEALRPSKVVLVTETGDLSADLLVRCCRRRGLPFLRFNQDQYPQCSSITWDVEHDTAEIAIGRRRFSSTSICSAWFRRMPLAGPTPNGRDAFVTREAVGFLASFWEASSWFWVNRPSSVSNAERKPLQLAAARRRGLTVPKTRITNDPVRARDFVGRRGSIAKAVVSAGVKERRGQFVVFTSAVAESDLTEDGSIRASPVIYQERIDSLFDLRVTVVGPRIFAAKIEIQNRADDEVDWRSVDPARICYEPYNLPVTVGDACRRLIEDLSLHFAALDFVVTPRGEYVFLEVNPSGQWGWIEGATGFPITDAIVDLLQSAGRD